MTYLDKFRLENKVAIVTGGSKGLGQAMAIGLGDVGAQVVVTSRTTNLIEATANEIVKNGGSAIAIPVDVKSQKSIDEMVSKVFDRFGRIDILINNAGIAPMSKTIDTSVEEWDDVMNTNLKSVFLLSKAVGKVMLKQKKGKIINIGSVLGIMASNVALPYCASKAGLAHMTRVLALEWAPYRINVNCIVPGFFETEMTKHQQEDEAHSKFLKFKIPFRRLGKPEEIIGAAIFLSSEASDYMTGSVLVIDGGYSIW